MCMAQHRVLVPPQFSVVVCPASLKFITSRLSLSVQIDPLVLLFFIYFLFSTLSRAQWITHFSAHLLYGKIPLKKKKKEGWKAQPHSLQKPLFCLDFIYLNIFPEGLNKTEGNLLLMGLWTECSACFCVSASFEVVQFFLFLKQSSRFKPRIVWGHQTFGF